MSGEERVGSQGNAGNPEPERTGGWVEEQASMGLVGVEMLKTHCGQCKADRDETLLEKKDLGNRKARTRSCGRLKTMPEAARGHKRSTGQRDTHSGNAGSVVKPHFSCHPSQQMPASGPRPRLWGRAGTLRSPGWSCCRCISSPSSHRLSFVHSPPGPRPCASPTHVTDALEARGGCRNQRD